MGNHNVEHISELNELDVKLMADTLAIFLPMCFAFLVTTLSERTIYLAFFSRSASRITQSNEFNVYGK